MQNAKINTILTMTALIVALLFVASIFFLTVQVYNNSGTDSATILSGVLSMFGGALGALGAYFVASMQIKKQFKKQDNDRVLELRINKLTETLNIAHELSHKLQVWYGAFKSVEINTKEKIDSGYTHLKAIDVFVRYDEVYLNDKIKDIVYLKDALKKNYIFFVNTVGLQEIYDNTSNVAEDNKKILNLLDFKTTTTIYTSQIKEDFGNLYNKSGNSYMKLDNSINILIASLEDEINRLLKKTLY